MLITYLVINAVEKMAEEQGFKSLKCYNIKIKNLFSLMLIWQEWTTNKKLNKEKKEKEEEYEYDNNNTEDIYDEDIDQEEIDGKLEGTEINPNYHQDKYKENYEYAEEK